MQPNCSLFRINEDSDSTHCRESNYSSVFSRSLGRCRDKSCGCTLKTEFDIQQPYLQKFRELTSTSNLRLVGITRLPFEPRSHRLVDVANTLWRTRTSIQIAPSLELNEDDKKLRVHVPQIADATWAKDNLSYRFGTHVYLLPLTGKVKRRKKGDSVELTWD